MLVRTLRQMIKAFEDVEKGDLSRRVNVLSTDELGNYLFILTVQFGNFRSFKPGWKNASLHVPKNWNVELRTFR